MIDATPEEVVKVALAILAYPADAWGSSPISRCENCGRPIDTPPCPKGHFHLLLLDWPWLE